MNDTLIPGQLYRFKKQLGILKFLHYTESTLFFKHHSEKHHYCTVGPKQLIPFSNTFRVQKKFNRINISQIIEVW